MATKRAIVRTSTAPVDPNQPIATGDNDTRNTDQRVPADGSVTDPKAAAAFLARIADLALDQTSPPTATVGKGFIVGSGTELAVTQQGVANLTVQIATGGRTYSHLGKQSDVAPVAILSGFTIPTVAGEQRKDVVVVDATGTVVRRVGLEQAPAAPDAVLIAGDVPLARVTLTEGVDTDIEAADIDDLRERTSIHGSKAKDDTINAKAMIDDTFDATRYLSKFAADSLTATVFDKVAAPGALSTSVDGQAAMAAGYHGPTQVAPGGHFAVAAIPALNRGACSSARLPFAVEPSAGENFIIDGHEFRYVVALSPPGTTAYTEIRLAGAVATTRTSAQHAINGTVDPAGGYNPGTDPLGAVASLTADVTGGTILRVRSSTARGNGTYAAAELSGALSETMLGGGNGPWNVLNLNASGGRAEAKQMFAQVSLVITTEMIAAGSHRVELPFTPTAFMFDARSTAGVPLAALTDAVSIGGNGIQVSLAGTGAPAFIAGDVLSFIATG